LSTEVSSSGRKRVVALLGPAGTAPELGDSADVVRAGSGYEAAAELLSAPTSALLVDLGRLTGPHVPLLALADKLKVPIVFFGTVSASLPGSALAAIRLVSAEHVAEALSSMLSSPGATEAGELAGAADVGPEARPGRPAPAPAKLTPGRIDDLDAAEEESNVAPSGREASPQAAPQQLPKETPTRAELDALLGELDALLEDNP
jgi:hypothetical protein